MNESEHFYVENICLGTCNIKSNSVENSNMYEKKILQCRLRMKKDQWIINFTQYVP